MSATQSLQLRLTEDVAAAMRHGRFAEALPLVERLGRLPDPPIGTAALRAQALFGLDRLESAEAAADLAVAATDAADTRQLRARIRLARGDAAGAADDAAAAVMATPGDRAAKGLLGICLLEASRWDEALFFLGDVATDADPPSVLQLAHAFARSGRVAAADELLAHCAARWPGLPGLAGIRAQAALLAARAEEAEAIARAAIAADGPSPALLALLAHAEVAQGRLAEGSATLAAASRLAPEDGYLAHLAAAAAGEVPDAAAVEYVTRVFDGYAPRFETQILSLGYRVPGLILRAVERLFPAVAAGHARLGSVLDLGCGTGLVGVVLDDLLPPSADRTLIGVDLSRRMLEQAAVKRLYTEFRHAELATVMAADTATYALITAADVFCYLGRLDPVLALCRARLAPDGVLLFTLERSTQPTGGWRLGRTGRFAHSAEYARSALAGAGLEIVLWQEESLRLEGADLVEGWLIGARAATAH